jgi:hypothetical protein
VPAAAIAVAQVVGPAVLGRAIGAMTARSGSRTSG